MRTYEKKKRTAPLLLLSVLLLTLLSRLVSFDGGDSVENTELTVIVLNLLIFVLPGIFYVRLHGTGYAQKLNFRFIGFSKIPVVIFLFFVMVCGSILLNYFLYASGVLQPGRSHTGGSFAYLSENLQYSGFGDVLLASLSFALLPAVCEEFLFRGVLQSEYQRLGGFCQILLSTLGFAMVHFSLEQLPIFLFNGFILSLCAYITRSCFASMLLHSLYNLFAVFCESYVWNIIAQPQSTVFFLFIIATVLLLFLMLAFGEGERLFYGYAISEVPDPNIVKLKKGEMKLTLQALLSPGFLLCVAVFAVTVLVQS